jgi:hypothetical protein
MDNCCQFADECPIFVLFNHPDGRVSRDMYCLGEFGQCKRRQLLMAGQQAPADMLPQGTLLSCEGDRARTIL